MMFKVVLWAGSLIVLASAVSLRSTPVHLQPQPQGKAQAHDAVAMAAKLNVSDQQWATVAKMRTGLKRIADGLGAVAFQGTQSKTSAGEAMQTFQRELVGVLNQTSHEKNATKALLALKTAQASVLSFTRDITARQTRLMKEDAEQKESLLLGVLMQQKTEPMEKQLETLKSPDFKGCDVVDAILKGTDRKTPLFQQVATYLDKHADKSPQALAEKDAAQRLSNGEAIMPKKMLLGKDGKPDISPIISALEVRLQHEEEGTAMEERHHDQQMKKFDEVMAKEKKNKRLALRIKSMKKSEERKYKKVKAQHEFDSKCLKEAIEAIKKGDMKKLMEAQAALQRSLKTMQAQSGKFVYLFIQMVHQTEGLDCPYCAAQCVDKCHSEGKPYVQCLTDCADAGK